MYETVVVPTDGSDVAAAAVEHAIDAAERHDATVHIVYVVDMRVASTAPGLAIDEIRQTLTEEGEQVTETLADRVRSAGLDVVTAVREGVPDDEILSYVGTVAADLVVMGTAGKSQRERLRVGSVTENVLRDTSVPVLAVPAE